MAAPLSDVDYELSFHVALLTAERTGRPSVVWRHPATVYHGDAPPPHCEWAFTVPWPQPRSIEPMGLMKKLATARQMGGAIPSAFLPEHLRRPAPPPKPPRKDKLTMAREVVGADAPAAGPAPPTFHRGEDPPADAGGADVQGSLF